MESVPESTSKKSVGFQHNDFYYSKKDTTSAGERYDCSFKRNGKCRGSCIKLKDGTVKLGRFPHTCEELAKKRKTRDAIKSTFSEPHMRNVGVAPIVDSIMTSEQHQDAAVKMKTENAYKVARYHRNKHKVPVDLPAHRKSDSLVSTGEELEASDGINYMWRGEQHTLKFKLLRPKAGTKAGNIVMAYDEKLIEKYGGAESINEDATYDSSPNANGCYQLCTTMVNVEDEGIPIMWAFMENKSEDSYTLKFERQRDTFPNFRPKRMMSDFEIAIRNAFIKAFEGASLAGCKFHYNKAIWGNAKKHGVADQHYNKMNNPKAHKQLRKLMALIHLPAEDYERGYNLVKEETLSMYGNHPNWVKYFGYSDVQWIMRVNGETMSVYQVGETTNNIIERYHKLLLALVHQNPDMKTFIRGLIDLLLKKLLRLDQIKNGLEHTKKLSRAQRESQERISKAVEIYTDEKINNKGTDEERIQKLLKECSYFEEEDLEGSVPDYLEPIVITRDQFRKRQYSVQNVGPKKVKNVKMTKVSAQDIHNAEMVWIGEGTETTYIDERTGILHYDDETRKLLNGS